MLTNNSITLWHKQAKDRKYIYTRTVFDHVSVQSDIKVNVLDNGLKSANVIKTRIPTLDTLDIANGDRVMIGTHDDIEPPNESHTVIGFADNRKGSTNMWHYKVLLS